MIYDTQTHQKLPPLNVLVVEDGLVNRVLAHGLLTGEGHTVSVAENGAKAVSRLQESPYDIVLMDVDMPVMDGLAATRTIRQQVDRLGRRIPVIALTSNTNQDECFAAGMDGFLSKPLDLPAFRHVATAVLQGRSA